MVKINCKDAGALLASVPPLIGFTPENSLVCLVCNEGIVVMTMRVDLPDPSQSDAFAEQIAQMVLGQGDNVVAIVLVFGGGELTSTGQPPHTEVITALHRILGDVHLPDGVALWAEACVEGARWCCYCGECGMSGTLPDPSATELAAASVAAGKVTHASREELASYVEAASEQDLARRAELLGGMSTTRACSSREGLTMIRDAVDASARGDLQVDDAFVARMALALDDVRVRDASLSFATDAQAVAAEHLFFTLTRECPAPYRAEPAALAAFYAYLRGEGALASVALDVAVEVCPEHQLSRLLRAAFTAAVPPAELGCLARQADIDAAVIFAEQADT
ncbi:DUF4192 domain-containing protein [Lentzea sp. BCCO 10_0061]|uniref:DUF4192 domain-containing protein n=1 Tax=Lentzea sokolovensis TaxID=3095429 RepID=A0ABU4UM64_9PSEU|nr:DUF4192 domain-containing protein [Lentzea sp. BCCO 10_0061]MDX8140573.1 DUF4192 domain-containing protein [Lentzea sp. BCCO 10_0061]